MTEYIVLKKNGDGWEPLKGVPGAAHRHASSAKAAISGAIGDSPEGGEYIAVPARSFRRVTVKVETKTALKFS